jgi:hypothetical protein
MRILLGDRVNGCLPADYLLRIHDAGYLQNTCLHLHGIIFVDVTELVRNDQVNWDKIHRLIQHVVTHTVRT